MTKGYLGIDIGSISTKGVIIDENRAIIARSYLWTEGNPTEASKNVVPSWSARWKARGGYRRRWHDGQRAASRGGHAGASVIKNEITAHAVGTTHLHPDVRTILRDRRPGFPRSSCVSDGIAVDYAMNTLVRRGHRLVSVVAGAPLGRGGGGVRRHRAHFHQAGQHRRALHRVR